MNLTYQVPRAAYTALLADMVRRNDRRPIRMVTTLLMTVGQMTAVVLLCVFRLQPGQRAFFLIWSALLAGLTLLRRCTVRQRAEGTLRRLEYSGQLPEDYWKEHTLRMEGGQLHLRYGAARLSCPLYGVTLVEEKNECLYIYCGGAIFDIVPRAAFSDAEAMAAFAQRLRDAARTAEAPKQEKLTEGAAWSMDEKAFENGQYLAFRTLYYRYRFLRPATFLRLAVSVAAVINLMNRLTPLNIAVSAAVLLLANVENISMIPFVSRLRIRREIGEWRGGSTYHLALREDTILFSSDRAQVQIPVHKLNLCEEVGPYYVMAWPSFPAVVIPLEAAHSLELSALIRQIKELAS